MSNRISNDVRNNANAFAAAQAGAKSNAQNLTTTDVRNNNGGNTLTVNEAAIPPTRAFATPAATKSRTCPASHSATSIRLHLA